MFVLDAVALKGYVRSHARRRIQETAIAIDEIYLRGAAECRALQDGRNAVEVEHGKESSGRASVRIAHGDGRNLNQATVEVVGVGDAGAFDGAEFVRKIAIGERLGFDSVTGFPDLDEGHAFRRRDREALKLREALEDIAEVLLGFVAGLIAAAALLFEARG